MKKLILAIAVGGLLVSCKTSATNAYPFPVYSTEDLGALLKAKPDNDTLYVTNFFATWCQPCVRELPHFKEEMKKFEGQKVKFTFVDVDQKEDWNGKVKDFVEKYGLQEHTILFDMINAPQGFATKHTAKWKGNAIPFTKISRGNMIYEKVGAFTSLEELDAILVGIGKK